MYVFPLQVSADLYGGDRDLYWEDYGSGDGPELTHVEGSGHGPVGRGPYDTYDDTEDDYDDWNTFDVHAGKDGHDEETAEGSGIRVCEYSILVTPHTYDAFSVGNFGPFSLGFQG